MYHPQVIDLNNSNLLFFMIPSILGWVGWTVLVFLWSFPWLQLADGSSEAVGSTVASLTGPGPWCSLSARPDPLPVISHYNAALLCFFTSFLRA